MFETTIPDVLSSMPSNSASDLLVHPTTLDACLQVMLVNIANIDDAPEQIWIPTAINTIQISNDIVRGQTQVLHGLCESSRSGLREMVGSIMTGNEAFDSHSGITMHGVTFTGLGPTQSLTSDSQIQEQSSTKLCAKPSWKPDLDLLETATIRAILGDNIESPKELVQFCSQANEVLQILCQRVLQNLNHVTESSLPIHLVKYIEWIRKRGETLQNGYTPPALELNNQIDQTNSTQEDPIIRSFAANYPFDGKLLLHVFESLVHIFRRETTASSVPMTEDDLAQFYKDTFGYSLCEGTLRNWIDLRGHKSPSLRVIEIGAGRASMTVPIIKKLGGLKGEMPNFSQWTFTDLSVEWFEDAKALLHDWEPRVEYKRLDIEDDPVTQGFDAESYDVVLAVNVGDEILTSAHLSTSRL